MSFETLTAFEDVRALMVEQKALLTLFNNAFATTANPSELVISITSMKDTYLHAAALLDDLANTACKNMDAAIDAAHREYLADTLHRKAH